MIYALLPAASCATCLVMAFGYELDRRGQSQVIAHDRARSQRNIALVAAAAFLMVAVYVVAIVAVTA